MARKKNDSPINMGTEDRIETLRRVSRDMVAAKEKADAARQPIKDLKAALKAAGMDNDLFNLVHGIAVLDDDGARRTRIDKLQLCVRALLGPDIEGELFGRHEVVSQRPTKAEALASTMLTPMGGPEDEAPEDEGDNGGPVDLAEMFGDGAPTDGAAAFADAPAAPDEERIDGPAAAWGEGIIDENDPALDSGGAVFNAGREAGRGGTGPDANPHDAGTPEHGLWERGRAKGEAERVRQAEKPAAAVAFDAGAKIAGTAEEKRIAAYWHGWNGTKFGLPSAELLAGRKGEVAKAITQGIADFNARLAPRFAEPNRQPRFTAKCTGTTAPSIDGVSALETAVLDGGLEVFRHVNASFVYAAIQALELADQRELLTGDRVMDIVRANCPQGYGFVFALGYPPEAGAEPGALAQDRPDGVSAVADADDGPALTEAAPPAGGDVVEVDFGLGDVGDGASADGTSTDDPPARIGVEQRDGKLVIVDLENLRTLIDAPSADTSEVWVRRIHEHFAERLDAVTHAELKDALRQLALGKALASPATTAPAALTDDSGACRRVDLLAAGF